MLDIVLLVLQIVTLILLFLFIWWVVRSARRDLARNVEGVQVGGEQQALPWDDAGAWPPAGPAQSTGANRGVASVGQGTEWDWGPDIGVAAEPAPYAAPTVAGATTGELPYTAAAAAVTAAPDVTFGGQSPAISGPEERQTGRAARAPERSSAVDGPDAAAVDSPRLVVESSPVLPPGQEIRLQGWLGIGRSPESDLALSEPFVSSTHARIVRRGRYFFVEDLGSTNGTYVNERRVTEAQLGIDTRLRIGETVFRYEE